ncbi:hypothetical protein NLJ89_g2824 [Agrocybe chaxingu]|uniref:F-box domain-containing protein n=1 Tax=Agrocybe chaxingu TaxID=84603 RepID=A0A9W8KBV6_9AGAR|nr:hypothetical protein NLJ89_g2824 [Agrocybe chaxingu]
MKFTLIPFALTTLASAVSLSHVPLTANTPSLPPGDSPGGPAIVDLGTQTGTSLTWVVTVAPGTIIALDLRDSAGLIALSAPVTRAAYNAVNNRDTDVQTFNFALDHFVWLVQNRIWQESRKSDSEAPVAQLTTNGSTTDAEIFKIKTILHNSDEEIRKIDEEISHIQGVLQGLRRKKEALLQSTKNYRAILSPARVSPSPIRRLSHDAMKEIFIACLPRNRNPSMCSDEPPMLLTQVSSQWRDIALATPQLWAAIHIAVPTDLGESGDAYLEELIQRRFAAVDKWLERSGALPLSISAHEPTSSARKPYFSALLQHHLIPVCGRLQHLDIMAYDNSLSPLQHLDEDKVPLLKSVRLRTHFSPSFDWNVTVSKSVNWKESGGIIASPSLRILQVSLSDIRWEGVRWSHLTNLDLDDGRGSGPPISLTIEALRQATLLISLVLQPLSLPTSPVDNSDIWEAQPIELPSLKHLKVQEHPGMSVLPRLRTPLLQILFYRRFSESQLPSPLLQYLALNVDMSLEKLTTDHLSTSAVELVECLRCCTSLRALRLGDAFSGGSPIVYGVAAPNHPLNDKLLELFAPEAFPETHEIVCPNIEDVELWNEGLFSEDAVVNFIRRKQSGLDGRISKLRSFKVCFAKRQGRRNIKLELASLCKGIKVDLNYRLRGQRSPISLYNGLPYSWMTDWS